MKGVSDWFGSHGCLRLEEADARTLFRWTPSGTVVQVY
jgi:lipoprotein-anchoring transpeptidase ErfK/SrfK